jgi:pseudaminic acid synthase
MESPLFIAEMSANHLGSLNRAKCIVMAAAQAGANAVKLQTFSPEQMVGNKDYVIPDGPWQGCKLIDLYRKAHTPREWHKELFDMTRKLGMLTVSSPFHPDDVEFLESLDCEIYKIASFELTYSDLLEAVAKTGKPIIISTGMADLDEILTAVWMIKNTNRDAKITILKCTSSYPALISDANLATMYETAGATGCDTGISDHTIGSSVAIAATMLGASIIEKHLTISRKCGGPDADFSMEPDEFALMVKSCKEAKLSIGEVRYGPGENEKSSLSLRRSLWFADDVPRGTIITKRHIKVARPALGMNIDRLSEVTGLTANRDIIAGEPVSMGPLSDA